MGAMNTLRQNTGVILWILVLSFGIIWTLQDSDVFSAMNQPNRNVATINGSVIQYEDYQRILEQQRTQYQQRLGGDLTPQMEEQMREQAYNQAVNQELLRQEMDRLGVSVTNTEIEDMVFGENPHPIIRQQFADSTGQINYQLLQNMAQNPQARSQWLQLEQFLRRQRRQQKMGSLVQATVQVSEEDVADYYRRQNTSASAQYVALRYAQVPDDSITVTESDLRTYYDENQEDFKRQKTFTIQYASKSKQATAEDTSAITSELEDLREEFAAAENDSLFLADNASDQDFASAYRTPDQMNAAVADAIYSNPEPGQIVGPVYGSGLAHLIKIRDTQAAESEYVHASHILLETSNADPGLLGELQAIRDTIESGTASFAQMARRHSDDASASDGGDLGWFAEGQMADAFEEAAFGAEPGALVGPVRSQFGYHLIRVESHASQAVQYVDLAYNLNPSQATLSDQQSLLGDLAYFAEDSGNFSQEADRLGLSLQTLQAEVDQTSFPGIGQSRALSRFLENASTGDISEVIELDDKFVVAHVTGTTPEGYRPFEEVKSQIRPQVELQQKRAVLLDRMRAAVQQTNFESLPDVLDTRIRSQSNVTYSTQSVPGIGRDPAFAGTVFGLEQGATSGVVEGANAAFVVQVTEMNHPETLTDQKREEIRKELLQQRRQQISSQWIAALKEDATIQDNRSQIQ